MKVKAI